MVVTAEFGSPPVVADTGFGLDVEEKIVRIDLRGGVVSHRFHPQIKTEADAEKLGPPQVIYDRETTDRNLARLNELFGDILAIRPYGVNLEASRRAMRRGIGWCAGGACKRRSPTWWTSPNWRTWRWSDLRRLCWRGWIRSRRWDC